MAISYDDSSQLMKDQTFIGRVKVACLHFATYILDEPSATPAHNTRERWAMTVLSDSDAQAMKVTPTVVLDTAVQAAGGAIDDASLQTAVETAVQKLI